MKPRPAHQRRQAHRQRKALARVRHQLRAIMPRWFDTWGVFQRGRGPKPERIKLPYAVKQHKKRLYRELWQEMNY